MSCVVAACNELGSGFESGHGQGVCFWPEVSGWTWRWVSTWEVATCSGVSSELGGDGW